MVSGSGGKFGELGGGRGGCGQNGGEDLPAAGGDLVAVGARNLFDDSVGSQHAQLAAHAR